MDQLRSENQALKDTIANLEAQLAAVPEGGSAETSAELQQRLKVIANREKALQVKADALAAKELLLQTSNEGAQ